MNEQDLRFGNVRCVIKVYPQIASDEHSDEAEYVAFPYVIEGDDRSIRAVGDTASNPMQFIAGTADGAVAGACAYLEVRFGTRSGPVNVETSRERYELYRPLKDERPGAVITSAANLEESELLDSIERLIDVIADDVRGYVNHRRIHSALMRDSARYRRVCAALDMIQDTGQAVGHTLHIRRSLLTRGPRTLLFSERFRRCTFSRTQRSGYYTGCGFQQSSEIRRSGQMGQEQRRAEYGSRAWE